MFSTRRLALVLAPAALIAVSMTACSLGGSTSPSSSATSSDSVSATPTASSTASSSASASATPSPSPSTTSTPVSIACGTLVSAQTVYNYNPNFVLLTPFTPKAGSAAARAKAASGTACEWVNTTSRDTIDVSVAHYDAATIAGLKSSAGTASSGWGADSGYFTVKAGLGTATAFVGNDWIVAASTDFGQATDADAFMNSAVAAVK